MGRKIGRMLSLFAIIAAVGISVSSCNAPNVPESTTTAKTEEITVAEKENTEQTSVDTEIIAETKDTTMEEEPVKNYENLTLCGVDYHYSSGSMFGVARSAHITDKEIVSASFYPWEGQNNYEGDETELIEIEHQPITAEQWAEIEKAIKNIMPILEEYHEAYNPFSVIGEAMMLDGGDKSGFSLTWRSPDGGEKTVSYYSPNDRRFYVTVIDTLMETVHPVGREIVWYGEPVLEGFHVTSGDSLSGRKGNFSFQCTKKDEEEWRYIAYFGVNGKAVSLNYTVDEACWSIIAEKVKALGIESLKTGEMEDKYIALYYSDNKIVRVLPDKKLLEELESFFTELSQELNKEQ